MILQYQAKQKVLSFLSVSNKKTKINKKKDLQFAPLPSADLSSRTNLIQKSKQKLLRIFLYFFG
jgi:hypothetical protein